MDSGIVIALLVVLVIIAAAVYMSDSEKFRGGRNRRPGRRFGGWAGWGGRGWFGRRHPWRRARGRLGWYGTPYGNAGWYGSLYGLPNWYASPYWRGSGVNIYDTYIRDYADRRPCCPGGEGTCDAAGGRPLCKASATSGPDAWAIEDRCRGRGLAGDAEYVFRRDGDKTCYEYRP